MYHLAKLITTTVVFTLLFSLPVCGQDYYLDIRDIPGEVTVPEYKDQICITSFSWEVTREVPATGGGAASAASPLEFKFGKSFDRASPLLFGGVADGRVIPEVIFTVVRANPEGPELFELMIYRLRNVRITGFQPGGMVESLPKEVISLQAEQVKISHFLQNPNGSTGDETTFEWNFSDNTGG